MSEPELLTAIDGPIARMTFNRPHARNAMTSTMLDAMAVFLEEIEDDPSVRCLVMSGAGEHFMAGGDVGDFESVLGRPGHERAVSLQRTAERALPVFDAMARLSIPVVVKVRGAVAGASITWVAAADFALISDTALFVFAHIHLGLSPDGGLTYHLPRVVGDRKARELILLGARINADEALAIGLANRLVPDAQLDAETEKLLARLAQGPGIAIARSKRLLGQSLDNAREEQMRLEVEALAACVATEDMVEGVRAFAEKRRPVFSGR